MAATPRKIKIHYRRATLEGPQEATFSLQQRLERVMKGPLGLDANQRLLNVTDDGQHKACLNYHELGAAFVADVMHLDGRTALPLWLTPKSPQPVADIVPRELKDDEASLGEPLYLLVQGNHVAAIERMGFRATTLQSYLNALLKRAGELEDGGNWRLAPKIETTGLDQLSGAIKKITFRPNAALVGDAPSTLTEATKGRPVSRRFGEFVAQGRKVIDMAVAAGADEAKLETLQAKLSNDLALKARLEISVASVRRKTTAVIDAGAVEQAFADLTSQGDVLLTSEDGRTNGKLIQLVHTTEVLETGGLIDWQHATQALVSALHAWAAKGSIDLSE